MTQYHKKQATIKNGTGLKYTFFSKLIYTNGQQVHKKVLDITTHWGNVDQSHGEASPHIC